MYTKFCDHDKINDVTVRSIADLEITLEHIDRTVLNLQL